MIGDPMSDKEGRAKLAEELRLLAKMLEQLQEVIKHLQYLTAASYDAARLLQNDADRL